jgi:predicted nucleic acid-binding protein
MANLPLPKAFALDSNVLIDLAAEEGFARDLLNGCRHKKLALKVPPTVIQELAYMARNVHGDAVKRRLANTALLKLRRVWGIAPFDLVAVGHGITDEFAKLAIEMGLLPKEEINDGLILAEVALANVPGLVTSDRHLLNIKTADLHAALRERDLNLVTVYKARQLSKLVT